MFDSKNAKIHKFDFPKEIKKMERIVKVVVPSFNMKGAFPRQDLTETALAKLRDEYITEQVALIKTVGEHPDASMLHREFGPVIVEKLLSPFQYWLENKIACDKLNEKMGQEFQPASIRDKEKLEAAKKFADRIDEDSG